MLSYQVEGAEQSAAFQSGTWDGRSTFFSFNSQTFPAGFIHLVQTKLQGLGHSVSLVRKPLPEPLGPAEPKIDPFSGDARYDYQPETVNRLLRHGQVIAQVATGGGKSRICNLAVSRIQRRCLFLTTRGVLMYQMRKSFLDGLRHRLISGERGIPDLKIGILGDGEWSPSGFINVGMVQTLAARLEEKTVPNELAKLALAQNEKAREELEKLRAQLGKLKLKPEQVAARIKALTDKQMRAQKSHDTLRAEAARKVSEHMAARAETLTLLASFELVILEEAHEAGGNGYYDILRHCKGAYYRLALTATPFMRGDAESNMRLMACAGPIAIKISEQRLIDSGILARPWFKIIPSQYEPDRESLAEKAEMTGKIATQLGRTSPYPRAYKLGIVHNRWRNEQIVKEVVRGAAYGLPAMVLVAHKAHGFILRKALERAGLRAAFIAGENDQTERNRALSDLKTGALQCVIGSTILDVGVDVPAVGLVVLAGSGKAEVALRQRIGRGLRSKKTGPNHAFVVDFDDGFNFHLKSHSAARLQIIQATPGFAEGILPPGSDFRLHELGFSKI